MDRFKEIIAKSNIKFSDRELAQTSVIFVAAYFIDLVVADIRNIPSSLKSVFIIWYLLLALKFPRIYIATLLVATLSFGLAFFINLLHYLTIVDNFLQVGLFLATIALIQIIILEWGNHKNK